MENEEKRFTIGEIASLTGLTVRTLQHYDNISLLPVSGRTEGGRRYYMERDMIRLEQIVFYKSIGISLNEIKIKLDAPSAIESLEETLNDHLGVILQKIDDLHLTMAVVETALETAHNGDFPPWKTMANLIRSFSGGTLMDWRNFTFDEELLSILKQRGFANSLTEAMEFYHFIRQVMVEASTLGQSGQAPDSPAAQLLAEKWWKMIIDITSGGDTVTASFLKVNENRDLWPENDRKLFESGEQFLEAALNEYIISNNIEVPEALR